jgi:16S rRNA processing protein RimM
VDPTDDNWMVIGEVTGPFGVRGEIKVSPLTDFPERYKGLKRVYLGVDRKGYAVRQSRMHQGRVLLKVQGIDTPEQVTALGHVDIAIPRAEAVSLPEGSYFLNELIGVRVRTSNDRDIGPITDVLRTGSNDVWVIGHGKKSVLIPAIADAVQELNVGERYAVILPWVLESEE